MLYTHNQPVIFTDVDLVWLNKAIPEYISHVMSTGGYDILYSIDRWNSQKNDVCTGLYAIKPTPFSLNFLKEISNDTDRIRTNDQAITVNHIHNLGPLEKNCIGYLPILWFQNGQVVDLKLSEKFGVSPWIIHANFRVGARDKMMLLKDSNVWYI